MLETKLRRNSALIEAAEECDSYSEIVDLGARKHPRYTVELFFTNIETARAFAKAMDKLTSRIVVVEK